MSHIRKNEIDLEIIMASSYCDIIKQIISRHSGMSINKLLVFSYIIKKDDFNNFDIYNGKNDKDLVLKALSQMAGNFDDFCENIQYILFATHLLIKNEIILQHTEKLLWRDNKVLDVNYSKFIDKAMDASQTFSDRQFLREVLSNV